VIVGELALPGRRHTRAEVRIVGVPDQRLPVRVDEREAAAGPQHAIGFRRRPCDVRHVLEDLRRDVMSVHRAIGRIFRSNSAPQDRPWMSTITTAVVVPAVPSHGFAATLAEAKTAFAAHWRRWLALQYPQPNAASVGSKSDRQ
jgi:hypothetical protein